MVVVRQWPHTPHSLHNVQMSHENNDFLSSDVYKSDLAVSLSSSYNSPRSPIPTRRNSRIEGRLTLEL